MFVVVVFLTFFNVFLILDFELDFFGLMKQTLFFFGFFYRFLNVWDLV